MSRKKAVLPENWKETICRMMSEGSHITAVIKELGIPRSAHYKFYEDMEEYREAIDNGKLLSEAWWTEQGRANVSNKNFNNTLFIFMMKAVFKWKDTHGTLNAGEVPANEDEKEAIRQKYLVKENQHSESLQ